MFTLCWDASFRSVLCCDSYIRHIRCTVPARTSTCTVSDPRRLVSATSLLMSSPSLRSVPPATTLRRCSIVPFSLSTSIPVESARRACCLHSTVRCACPQSGRRHAVERSSLSRFSLLSLCCVSFCAALVPLRGDCDCCLYFIRRSFVSRVHIQVTCKQGIRSLQSTTLPTTQWHKQSKPLRLHERIRRTAMFQGSRTAVAIRRNVLCHSKQCEPNRRPYTTERPRALKTHSTVQEIVPALVPCS